MENRICVGCGKPLIPCPARFDGEDTFVGYFPCTCNKKCVCGHNAADHFEVNVGGCSICTCKKFKENKKSY
jgi:hypothetical protein